MFASFFPIRLYFIFKKKDVVRVVSKNFSWNHKEAFKFSLEIMVPTLWDSSQSKKSFLLFVPIEELRQQEE